MDPRLTSPLASVSLELNSKLKLSPIARAVLMSSWPSRPFPDTLLESGFIGPERVVTLDLTGQLMPPECFYLRMARCGPVNTSMKRTFILLFVCNKPPATPTFDRLTVDPGTLSKTSSGLCTATVEELDHMFREEAFMGVIASRKQRTTKSMNMPDGVENARANLLTRSTGIGPSVIA